VSREGREADETGMITKFLTNPSQDRFVNLDEEQIGKAVLDAAFRVHSELGPGLLVYYDDICLDVGFRADLIVEEKVLVELKSVETITPLFKKITTNYLKLIPLRLGFLINFNEHLLKNGITRVVNGLDGKGTFNPSPSSRPSRDILPT